jgi:signal peptidase I
MKSRALRLALALSLLASGGCGMGRAVRSALSRRMVRVPTEGMLPTIKPGDLGEVDQSYYNYHPVRRFDMVTFQLSRENVNPELGGVDENTVLLQRVIGLGGETVEVKGGRVYVNGLALEEPFATVPPPGGERFGPFEVPPGEFFMMGDNRGNSLDSRYWARPTITRRQILGKVVELFPQ